MCSENDEEENNEINYEEYLECTAVEKTYYQKYYNKTQYYEQEVAYQNGYNRRAEEENDDNVYLKIFCDGSIKIGIFSDDECTNYIGETTTIYKETGLNIVENELQADYMDNKCVSCAKSVSNISCRNFLRTSTVDRQRKKTHQTSLLLHLN